MWDIKNVVSRAYPGDRKWKYLKIEDCREYRYRCEKGSRYENSFPDKYDFQVYLPSMEAFLQDVRAAEARRLGKSSDDITLADLVLLRSTHLQNRRGGLICCLLPL